ncbi:MAG: hypothetical protein HN337_09915, partial [Deltaproteobacteria bacterium]|nr:hypothetical protein [Deltaproteobacteria bacterium]
EAKKPSADLTVDRDAALSTVHKPAHHGTEKLFGDAAEASEKLREEKRCRRESLRALVKTTSNYKALSEKIGEEKANIFLDDLLAANCTNWNDLHYMMITALESKYSGSTCKYLPKMWSAGIRDAQVLYTYSKTACDFEGSPYDPSTRFEGIIEADLQLRERGISSQSDRVRLIKATTYSDDKNLCTKMKNLPETAKNILDQGWTMDETIDLIKTICKENGAGKDGAWALGRLDEALEEMGKQYPKYTIQYLLSTNWKKYVKVGIEKRTFDNSDNWFEKAEDSVAETVLDDPTFYSQYVSPDFRDEYIDVISRLRLQGFRDSEIKKMICNAYNKVPVYDERSEQNKDKVILHMKKKMDALDIAGVSTDLSISQYQEIMTENINAERLKRGANTFFLNTPNNAYRKLYLKRLGAVGFINYLGLLGNDFYRIEDQQNVDVSKIAKLCLQVKEKRGINHFSRYSVASLENQLHPKPGAKTALVVVAKDDWNGAFERTRYDLDLLLEQGYNVIIVEANDENDIYRQLDSMPAHSIDQMVIYGHGRPSGTSLRSGSREEDARIDLDDNEWRLYQNRFSDEAQVFLFSCSTGKGGEEADNMGSRFNQWLGLTTYAPNEDTNGALYVTSNGEIAIRYNTISALEVFDDHNRHHS